MFTGLEIEYLDCHARADYTTVERPANLIWRKRFIPIAERRNA
jgi:hypothetical protein